MDLEASKPPSDTHRRSDFLAFEYPYVCEKDSAPLSRWQLRDANCSADQKLRHEAPRNGSVFDSIFVSDDEQSPDEVYDAEPPPGYKTLKRIPSAKTNRRVSLLAGQRHTSALQQGLGDGFSSEEAKPLQKKTGSGKKSDKRKRCEPSPVMGTLEVATVPTSPAHTDRKIVEPLRPSRKKASPEAVKIKWIELDKTLGADDCMDYDTEFDFNEAVDQFATTEVDTSKSPNASFATLPPLRC